jgi:hypothetical protein
VSSAALVLGGGAGLRPCEGNRGKRKTMNRKNNGSSLIDFTVKTKRGYVLLT